MKVRLGSMVFNGPITGTSIYRLYDTADTYLKKGSIADDAVVFQGTAERQRISIRNSAAERRLDCVVLTHSGSVVVEMVNIPAAAGGKIHLPICGLALYSEKQLKTCMPPQFMTAFSDRKNRGPFNAFQRTL
jgi:hypothetical protein